MTWSGIPSPLMSPALLTEAPLRMLEIFHLALEQKAERKLLSYKVDRSFCEALLSRFHDELLWEGAVTRGGREAEKVHSLKVGPFVRNYRNRTDLFESYIGAVSHETDVS